LITVLLGVVNGAKLDVSIDEKVGTIATYKEVADGSFDYTTNVTGFLNVTNNGNDNVYDIWIAVNLSNVDENIGEKGLVENDDRVEVFTSNFDTVIPKKVKDHLDTNGATHVIHITHIKPGETISLYYDVNDSAIGIENGTVFYVEEKYNTTKIPAYNTKTWKVFFNVSINETLFNGLKGDQNVSMRIVKYLSNQTDDFGSTKWQELFLTGDPQVENGGGNAEVKVYNGNYTNADKSTSVVSHVWLNETVGDKYVNITFNVTGKNNVTEVFSLEPFGFAVLFFDFSSGNLSGSRVIDCFAVGDISLGVNKSGPYWNDAQKKYVDWKANVTIRNEASGLVYTIHEVNMWVTENDIGKINQTRLGPVKYNNNGNGWSLNAKRSLKVPNNWWEFTFDPNKVPVVWANVTFEIVKGENGWNSTDSIGHKQNASYDSDFIVIEKIYVIGKYLVKVTKHVRLNESANNVYDVYLVVENVGGTKSPNVYVYDLIPNNFTAYNWNDTWSDPEDDGNWVNKSSMFITNGSTGDWSSDSVMNGYCFGVYWKLNQLNGGADGDGNWTDWDEIENNQSVVIRYQIKGEGAYRMLDVFVVGIDPIYAENEQTSPKAVFVSGAKSSNYEGFFAFLTMVVSVIGVVVVRRT
jgi:hypothetical protein